MKDSIVIRGNKYGLTLYVNEESDKEKLKEELLEKLKVAKSFLREGNIALAFEGKELSLEEQQELIELINENADVKVMCIVDTTESGEYVFKEALSRLPISDENKGINEAALTASNPEESVVGSFHKGTLRSGQLLEADNSVVIIGDVNPGANIVSKGNIVVLGSLKGNAYAGANGDTGAFVVALKMNAMQIRIADTIARCPDNQETSKDLAPQIAFISENNICIENLY